MHPGCWLIKPDSLEVTYPPVPRLSSPHIGCVRCSMSSSFHGLLGLCLCAAMLGLAAGCKSAEQSDSAPSSSSAEPSYRPNLANPAKSVRTIQLYQGDDERRLPVASLGGETSVTLEFDLMTEQGRPLSVYFQHADRRWRRDLSSSQVLESFQNDRLLDYRPSRGTDVSYVHYRYRFPNDDIRFRISGNYILRVTERGRPDSVLFEQPFFVAEQEGELQLRAESLTIPGQQVPSILPKARYQPPSEIQGDPFGHTVCFVRNGRLADTRCEDRPLLVRQPELEFELERDRAYAPSTAEYDLDLSALRATNRIARIDRTNSPLRAILEPDYARFESTTAGPNFDGQTVVRGALSTQVDPALSAEYVETVFAFVPSGERPYSSPLMVAGSFSGMSSDRGTRMEWNDSRGQYEGTVLLKQGQYEYFYSSSDPTFTKQLQGTQRRISDRYTAFVYYQDSQYNTDRLLQVNGFAPR